MLEGDSEILETSREASRLLVETTIEGAIIGGVAVALHGYVRTALDVDIFLPEREAEFAALLQDAGFRFGRAKREFVIGGIPVHFVTRQQIRTPPQRRQTIERI